MSDLRNPLKVARGLGSAKDGTSHFIHQRVTAIALVFLGIYFLGLVVSSSVGGYDAVHAAIRHPANAVLVVAFVIAMCWHGALGMQVVIEDYVHSGWGIAFQLLNRFVFAIVAIAGVLSVIRIALGN